MSVDEVFFLEASLAISETIRSKFPSEQVSFSSDKYSWTASAHSAEIVRFHCLCRCFLNGIIRKENNTYEHEFDIRNM